MFDQAQPVHRKRADAEPSASWTVPLPMAVTLFRITSPIQYIAAACFIAWAYGIELSAMQLVTAAAQIYFGKSLEELSISEAAYLAALPQAPNSISEPASSPGHPPDPTKQAPTR